MYYFNQKAARKIDCCESTKNAKTKKGQKRKLQQTKTVSVCVCVGGSYFKSFLVFSTRPRPFRLESSPKPGGLRPRARFAASPRRSPLCRVDFDSKILSKDATVPLIFWVKKWRICGRCAHARTYHKYVSGDIQ